MSQYRTSNNNRTSYKSRTSNNTRKRRKRRRKHKRGIGILFPVCLILSILLIGIGIYACMEFFKNPVNEKVTIEVGGEIKLEDFIIETEDVKDSKFVTDFTTVDVNKIGHYSIQVECGGKAYDSTLIVQDTVAPTASAVETTTKLNIMPNVKDLVTDIVDKTNVSVVYKVKPDVSKAGETTAVVTLLDLGNNTTDITVKIKVISDEEAPVIEGAKDLFVEVGDTVSYRKDITVTDNEDTNPTLTIDNSQVDLSTPGEYKVIYTATDVSGNSSSVEIKITVEEKGPKKDREEVYALARKVLDKIIDDSMTDMEKAFAVYRWTNTNIMYTGTSNKSHWTIGAYDAFKNMAGDCYNYYAAAKAMFDVLGIENVDIVKSDTSHSSHFWSIINLGDGWYHVDCTPRKGSGDLFFMVTDAELEAYSVKNKNSHIYIGSLYPERATKSLQNKVDYVNGVIKD